MTPDPERLGREADALLRALARVSDDDDRLTRLFLTPAHRRAADLVAAWMRDEGLDVSVDALGTVRGRLTSPGAGNRILLVGSHIDTVVDAGRYDGTLGVVAGLLAVREIKRRGERLPFAVDVLAFGDEEGVRFPVTLLSSAAIAGQFPDKALDATDAGGRSVREALVAFGGDPAGIATAAYDPAGVVGYLEVHIEQGPVLESEALPLGVVTGIAGQSRFRILVTGEAGHAGTVPMHLRRDALAGAAEIIAAVEAVALAGAADALVATVGRLTVRPGAVNVIPGEVEFTLDVRAGTDAVRLGAIAEMRRRARATAEHRHLGFLMQRFHDRNTTPASPAMQAAVADGIRRLGLPVRQLASGAGHDGLAVADLTGIGMLLVRCRGGISHSPLEHVEPADMGLAVEALVGAILSLAEEERGA